MKTNREIQQDYKTRMKKNGFVQLAVWIKKEKKEELKKMIKQLNEV